MDYMSLTFIGKVKEQPQINAGEGGKKQAFFTLVVATNRVKTDSGQWVDKVTEVPIFATDKVAETIEQNVVLGQELQIDAVYENTPENWGRWVLRAKFVKLGWKPKGSAKPAAGIPV